MSFKNLYKILSGLLCVFIIIPVLFIPAFSSDLNFNSTNISQNFQNESYKFEINEKRFVWPTPRIY